jgi:hypothetical protein
MRAGLSKSKLMSYLQCPKRLWLETHRPELKVVSGGSEFGLALGHELGVVARQQFEGGILIAPDNDLRRALAETKSLIAADTRQPLFEATFEHDGLLVRADVLQREAEGWHLREVKSSASVKPYQVKDLTVQRAVLEADGLQLRSASLMHVDTSFVYGGDGRYGGLFNSADLTAETRETRDLVPQWVQGARQVIAGPEPVIGMGAHCTDPYDCPMHGHCTTSSNPSEYPVTLLPNKAGKKVAEQLLAKGIKDLREADEADVANNGELTLIHRVTSTGRPFLDESAKDELDRLPYPRAWFDFETIAFAVPRWAGTKPYQQVPFQWSCHIEDRDGSMRHTAFLDLTGTDPRRACAEALVRELAGVQCVIAWHAVFEIGRLRELAATFPDLRDALEALVRKTWDILPLVRRCYYHRDMKGSRSLKDVVPTVLGYNPYERLGDVREGGGAQMAYFEAVQTDTADTRRRKISDDLLSYCKLDTWAMIAVARFLQGRTIPSP